MTAPVEVADAHESADRLRRRLHALAASLAIAGIAVHLLVRFGYPVTGTAENVPLLVVLFAAGVPLVLDLLWRSATANSALTISPACPSWPRIYGQGHVMAAPNLSLACGPKCSGDQIPTTAIDLSSTLGTPSQADGINDIGTIVGTHTVNELIWSPFRWSAAGVQDLSFGSQRFCFSAPICRALALNDNDEAVGDWLTSGEVPRGLVWLDDVGTAISAGTAYAINDATTVVGFNVVPVGIAPGTFAYRWTPSTGLHYLDPGAPGFFAPESEARAIRNDGVVAGSRDGQAVIWQLDGTVTELGSGVVDAISDRFLAVGQRGGSPIAWHDGTAIQISLAQGEAFDVNEAGYVVGTIMFLGEPHAFVWHETRGLQDLGPGTARGIDEAGHIVGWRTTNRVSQATLWQAELRVQDLFIGLEAMAGRLLAGIDATQAEDALRDISRAQDAWAESDSKEASQFLGQALDAVEMLQRQGILSDIRATPVLSLGNTLADLL